MITFPQIAIIVPVLNEESTILNNIEVLNTLSNKCNVVFVDGNSTDNTVQILEKNKLKIVTSPRKGRGAQLAYGASHLNNTVEVILFLHIDTTLPEGFESMILEHSKTDYWGWFNIKLGSEKTIFKIIQFMMNLRSKLTGIATGDQAIYVTKNEFMNHLEEMNKHPLMEDIYLSKALNSSLGRGYTQKQSVSTSVRYWESRGIITTILKMWKYRSLYFFGTPPNQLYQQYYK